MKKYIKQLELLNNNLKKIHIVDNSIKDSFLKNDIKNIFIEYFEKEYKYFESCKNKYNFVDLFCGAGGLSLGLEKSDLFPILALDSYKTATDTYIFNRPYLNENQVLTTDIKKNHELLNINAPLVVGGPPCQGFSNANKQKKENDERNELYKYFIQVVSNVQPDLVLMENVEGLLKYKEKIEKDFLDNGYIMKPYLLNTKDFGFPQNRKRVFFIGINLKHDSKYDKLIEIFQTNLNNHLLNNQNFVLEDAIKDLPVLKAKTVKNATYKESSDWGYTFSQEMKFDSDYAKLINNGKLNFPLLNHKSKYNNDRDIEIYSLLDEGDNSTSSNISHINPYIDRAHMFKDKFFKLKRKEISKTITAHMYYDCHMYIHPYSSRGLTPREAARIQGFPDTYFFTGTPNEWYRQIGNAVSPLIANIIGLGLKKMLDEIYE